MEDRINEEARQFLSINVAEMVQWWLGSISISTTVHATRTDSTFFKNTNVTLGYSFLLLRLLTNNPHITHLLILSQIEPYAGHRSKQAFGGRSLLSQRFAQLDEPFYHQDQTTGIHRTITSSGHMLNQSSNIPLKQSLLDVATQDMSKYL